MKLSNYKKTYYEFSGKTSDVARTAAFAGIALIWVFKIEPPAPRLPTDLIFPVGLFAFGLAFDLLQYIIATFIWGIFYGHHESKLTDVNIDPQISHPSWFQIPIMFFFILKLLSIIIGYICVARYILKVWF